MDTKILEVNPNLPQRKIIKEAAEILKKGGLVVFPTETVYGVGAKYSDREAVKKLYEIKKRPADKPFTLQIADFAALRNMDIVLSGRSERIVHKFWPGPLTILAFDKKGQKTGLRMPANRVALELLKESGFPVAVPSANISGNQPPASGKKAISEMNGLVNLILDAGPAQKGIGSTILDVTEDTFRVIREGAISREDLLSDYHLLFICTGNSCRSVMAAYFMRKFLEEAGLSEKISVDSAGTGSYDGMRASENTVAVMSEENINVRGHIGGPVSREKLRKADFIFVMERAHRDIILSRYPGHELKIKLLKERSDIPDPIGRSIEEYKKTRDIIKSEVENIFLELFKKEKGR